MGPLNHHRDVVLAQGVGQHPAVHPADQHHPVETLSPLEPNDLGNLLGVVGVDVERRRPSGLAVAFHKQALHRLHAEVALGRLTLSIRLGPGEEVPDLVQLLVVGLALAELRPAILEVLVVGGRPVEVDAVVGPHHGVLPVPRVELDHGARAADDPSAWRDLAHQDPVGPDRGRDVGRRVVGDNAADIGLERAHLRVVAGGAHRGDLHEAECAVGRDEAGVDVLSLSIHHTGIPLRVDIAGSAHIVDEAVGKPDGGVLEDLTGAQVSRATENEDAFRLRGARREVGLGQRGDCEGEQGEEGVEFHGVHLLVRQAVHRFSSVMVSQW